MAKKINIDKMKPKKLLLGGVTIFIARVLEQDSQNAVKVKRS